MMFIKLMKKEPIERTNKRKRTNWTLDEGKYLNLNEIKKLRKACNGIANSVLKDGKVVPVRNWFMVELGLNTGLRVEEMASLKHSDLIIDSDRSSIVVIGKGNKKRAVWINADFKRKCQLYFSLHSPY